ncbi:MAG: cohesin domain-containing protein [Proteobacteria bacterium]|nr:cohesin domain-containing protein [Pseudomonadota bacterium]
MNRATKTFCLLALLLLALPRLGIAATVYAPPACGVPGGQAEVIVSVDEVRGLAGFKLVLTYDAGVLEYVFTDRTGATRSMMHVVNDREPGRLIVVMAAARGISGRDVPLARFTFRVREDAAHAGKGRGAEGEPGQGEDPAPARVCSPLSFTGGQLMGDDLKEIPLAFGLCPQKAP